MPETVAQLIAKQESAKLASQRPLQMLNTQEKRARFAELRKKMGRSKLEVQGDPNKHYFWAGYGGKGDVDEMARLSGMGYVIVREPYSAEVLAGTKEPLISANGLKEDGTYVLGDVILTQCDMDIYEFLQLADSERFESMATEASKDFQAEAESHAVPTFEHNK